MSLVDICEEIGMEIRQTPQGRLICNEIQKMEEEIPEIELSLFHQIEENYYFSHHFFAGKIAAETIQNYPKENELALLINKLSAYPSIFRYGDSVVPVGQFVQDITTKSFQSEVRYTLPGMLTPTPRLIRLVQDLTVECQKTNIVQNLLRIANTDSQFLDLLHKFESTRTEQPNVTYSKHDRQIIPRFIRLGYKKNSVEIIYAFKSIVSFIETSIYDGFRNNIFTLHEIEDIQSKKTKRISEITVLRAQLQPNENTLMLNEKWIMRYIESSGRQRYGQIYVKRFEYNHDQPPRIFIEALLYDIL